MGLPMQSGAAHVKQAAANQSNAAPGCGVLKHLAAQRRRDDEHERRDDDRDRYKHSE
jgi:hypothetical protein